MSMIELINSTDNLVDKAKTLNLEAIGGLQDDGDDKSEDENGSEFARGEYLFEDCLARRNQDPPLLSAYLS